MSFEEAAVEVDALKVGDTCFDEVPMRLEIGPRQSAHHATAT
jgi:hypothetical protein